VHVREFVIHPFLEVDLAFVAEPQDSLAGFGVDCQEEPVSGAKRSRAALSGSLGQ
jgi:hypothetical protein